MTICKIIANTRNKSIRLFYEQTIVIFVKDGLGKVIDK